MKKIRFQFVILAMIVLTQGCSALSTATRRTGHMVRMVTIDTPLSIASSLSDAAGRMHPVGMKLSSRKQFEKDVGGGGDTTAKVIERQFQ